MAEETQSDKLLNVLREKFGDTLLESGLTLGDVEVRIARDGMKDLFQAVKEDSGLDFALFLSVTAVDYMDSDFMERDVDDRFDLVYHLLSLSNNCRLRIKIAVPEDAVEVDSLVELWPGADFMESEVWDMYGIKFNGHPNLRRILMYDEFVGHPLRKDYPVQGKQPRIKMRHPEVHNTARDMLRAPLVQINKRAAQ